MSYLAAIAISLCMSGSSAGGKASSLAGMTLSMRPKAPPVCSPVAFTSTRVPKTTAPDLLLSPARTVEYLYPLRSLLRVGHAYPRTLK